jgi:hypothetical protein
MSVNLKRGLIRLINTCKFIKGDICGELFSGYKYLYIYIYIYILTYINIYMYIYIHNYMCICLCTYICLVTCICPNTCKQLSMFREECVKSFSADLNIWGIHTGSHPIMIRLVSVPYSHT